MQAVAYHILDRADGIRVLNWMYLINSQRRVSEKVGLEPYTCCYFSLKNFWGIGFLSALVNKARISLSEKTFARNHVGFVLCLLA